MGNRMPYGAWVLRRVEGRDGRYENIRAGIKLRFDDSGSYTISPAGQGGLDIKGRFEVHGDQITRWVDPGLQLLDIRFDMDDEHLALILQDGKTFQFDRVGEAAAQIS